MSKILILPDLHGRNFWEEPCSHADEFDKIIFLGDVHDPYTFQVSQEVSRHNLRDKLLPFIKEHKDKIVFIVGNHDFNYLVGDCADRIDRWHRQEITEYLKQIPFQLVYDEIPGYLFSHSGVLPTWLETNGLTLENLNSLEFNNPVLMQISPMRGGWNECGSPVWSDVVEYDGLEHIPNLYQIFGHTQLQEKPIIKDDYACLDCRKAFILNTETKELKEYESTNSK